MADGGIRRKVDDLGRVVVPASIRRAMGLEVGDEVEVTIEGDRIVMARAANRCTFCGADAEGTSFHDKPVCWSCTAALRALDREHTDEGPEPAPSYF